MTGAYFYVIVNTDNTDWRCFMAKEFLRSENNGVSKQTKIRQTALTVCYFAIAVFAIWEIVSVILTGFNGYQALEGKFWEHKKRMFLMFPVYCLLLLASLIKLTAFFKEWVHTKKTPVFARNEGFSFVQAVSAIALLVSVLAWAFTDENLCKQLAYLSLTVFAVGYSLSCSQITSKYLRLRVSLIVSYVVCAVGVIALMLAIANAFNAFDSVTLVSEGMYYAYEVSSAAFIGCLISCTVFTVCTAFLLLSAPFAKTED